MQSNRFLTIYVASASVLGIPISSQKGLSDVFYNLDVPPGISLLSVPVLRSNNTISDAFQGIPAGSEAYMLSGDAFTTNRFDGLSWGAPDQSFLPGQGVFLFISEERPVTITISGQLLSGRITNSIVQGLSLTSAKSLVAGRISTEMGLVVDPFDNVYLWRTNGYQVFTALPGGMWHPFEPVVQRSEAFFINTGRALQWIVDVAN